MKFKAYKAFTLIEMLIVMGILVILMTVGIAAGRFAMDRSNEIAHKNGATQLYQAAQSHYTDEGEFPKDDSSIEQMTSSGGVLAKYLDMGSFKGGSEATYYYFTNKTQQAVLICVTLGGQSDVNQKGIACVGNGFGDPNMTGAAATVVKEKLDPVEDYAQYRLLLPHQPRSGWDGKKWVAPTPILEPDPRVILPVILPKDNPCSSECVESKTVKCLDVESPACM